MIIKREQIKAARRHAYRMGFQIAQVTDPQVREQLVAAWGAFLSEFGDPFTDVDNVVIRNTLADEYITGGAVGARKYTERTEAWQGTPVYITSQ